MSFRLEDAIYGIFNRSDIISPPKAALVVQRKTLTAYNDALSV